MKIPVCAFIKKFKFEWEFIGNSGKRVNKNGKWKVKFGFVIIINSFVWTTKQRWNASFWIDEISDDQKWMAVSGRYFFICVVTHFIDYIHDKFSLFKLAYSILVRSKVGVMAWQWNDRSCQTREFCTGHHTNLRLFSLRLQIWAYHVF